MKDQWNREEPARKLTGDGPQCKVLMVAGEWIVPPEQRPQMLPPPEERHGPDLKPYHTFGKGQKR